MSHPYWPLFDLCVRTPRLTIRYIDDELGVQLATLAASGIHDPDYMPFVFPWSNAPSPDLDRDALRFYWRARADSRPESWNLQFGAFEGAELVGSTNLIGNGFPLLRTFETGSWLGRAYQGRGIGTEMRVATLHVGFVALDALTATTGAFEDNGASLGVTRKLGYEPNGVQPHARQGQRAEVMRYQMTRRHFLDRLLREDIVITGDEPVRELLGIERVSP